MNLRLLLPLLAFSGAVAAHSTPPTAKVAIERAEGIARRHHKHVLIDFRASWCPWCVKFEELLADKRFGPKFRASYVIVPITVREIKPREAEENLGWQAEMAAYRPTKDQDIPYIVILNGRGDKLGDSYEPAGRRIPNNAGFPQTKDEIEAYLTLLRRTGKAFTAADLEGLKSYFEQVRLEPHNHSG